MFSILKQFDPYSLKARLFPALIAGLPTLALIFVIVPWHHLSISQPIALLMGAVLLFAFADMARSRGKNVQAKLGTGETPEQWHRGNSDIPEGSKDRFRAYIAGQLKITAPSHQDEQIDPTKANDFYRSAGAWLRDRTSSDTRAFPILFGENVSYGFRRNLLGLKPIALVCNAVVLLCCAAFLYFEPSYLISLPQIGGKLIIVMAAIILHSAYMIFAVNKATVREASRTYGRQLILSCDRMIKNRSATASPKSRKSDGSS